jgi:ankyrin repeat protein
VRRAALALPLLLLAACGGSTDRPRPSGDEAVPDLVTAAAAGDTAEVRRLLAAGADAETTRALIDAGADVDLQDDDRSNALLVCGETGDVAVLREVLRARPDLTRTNRFGGTALIPASDRGHVEVVRELLRTRIDVDHVNRLGWTGLLEAVILGDGGSAHQEIVRLLVDAGADTSIADRDGVTPLEHAQQRGYDEMVRTLTTGRRR